MQQLRSYPVPANEIPRLAALSEYYLDPPVREPAFDHVTDFAADLFGVDIALVSIVGDDVQTFCGVKGLDAAGTPRDIAFCTYAILANDVLVVPDATKDERFRNNPLVTGPPHIRFYAGAPLTLPGGFNAGTLCLIDKEPRTFAPEDQARLQSLGRTVVDLLELRIGRIAAELRERELAYERELLGLVVHNVRQAVALFDEGGGLTLWNDSLIRSFALDEAATVRGAPGSTLFAHHPELAALLANASEAESRIDLKVGSRQELEVWTRRLTDGRLLMTARDVSDERKAARLREQLVSTVSHELRTPLTSINGSLRIALSGAAGTLPEKVHNLLELGQRNVGRLMELINDLLDIDKMRSGRMELNRAAVDLRALIAEVAGQMEPYAEQFEVALKTDVPGEAVLVSVDYPRMVQVLTNLLSNASKFSPAESTVTLSLMLEGQRAVMRIADQGPGVSAEFRERLFTPFSQEYREVRGGHAGTGLGLTISKAIVEAHGGELWLESPASGGAVFCVGLPISEH